MPESGAKGGPRGNREDRHAWTPPQERHGSWHNGEVVQEVVQEAAAGGESQFRAFKRQLRGGKYRGGKHRAGGDGNPQISNVSERELADVVEELEKTIEVVEEQKEEIATLNVKLRERADPAARELIAGLEKKLTHARVEMKDIDVDAQRRLHEKDVELESMSVELQRKEQENGSLRQRIVEAESAAEYWKAQASLHADGGQASLFGDLSDGGFADRLSVLHADHSAEVAEFEERILQLTNDSRERDRQHREEREAWDRALQAANDEKAALEKVNANYKRVSGEQEDRLATFREQLESLKGTVQHDERALAVQLKSANAEIQHLQEENEELRGEIERQAHRLARHAAGDAVNEMLEKEAQTKGARVREAEMTQRDARKAQAQIHHKDAAIQALKTENDGLKEKLDRLLPKQDALENERASLLNDLDSEREELSAARAELEDLLEHKALWQAELEQLEAELAAERHGADELHEQLRVAEATLDELGGKVGKADHTTEAVSRAAEELGKGVAGGLDKMQKLTGVVTLLRNVAGPGQNNDMRGRSNKLLYTLSAALNALNEAGLEVQGHYEDLAQKYGVEPLFAPFGSEFVETIFAQIYFEEGEAQETMQKLCDDFSNDLNKRFNSIGIEVESLTPIIEDVVDALSAAVGPDDEF